MALEKDIQDLSIPSTDLTDVEATLSKPLYSGYTFGQVKSMLINDIEIYTGVLKKGSETLQTAWWYDNGQTQTVSQTEWRTAILKGEPNFNLVNITAADTATLYKNIKLILKNN